jgi:release factor glutamine methyltransferase
MRRIPAKIISPFLQRFIKHYFKKSRSYRYQDIRVIVNPGVFFPHFTLSTKLLLEFLENHSLTHKTFLELGCGTGLVSVFAAKNGAIVTASDINPAAIENATLNAKKNKVEIKAVLSDLFVAIPQQHFDYIIINPPYYPKAPKNSAEQAWFCGQNFEYFEALFPQLGEYFNNEGQAYMILSEDCKFENISAIALKNNLKFETVFKKQKWGEISFIYRIEAI